MPAFGQRLAWLWRIAAAAQRMQPMMATSKTAQKNSLNHVDFIGHLPLAFPSSSIGPGAVARISQGDTVCIGQVDNPAVSQAL
jgi:hypothetical protein